MLPSQFTATSLCHEFSHVSNLFQENNKTHWLIISYPEMLMLLICPNLLEGALPVKACPGDWLAGSWRAYGGVNQGHWIDE